VSAPVAERLPSSFYARPVLEVAPALLGCVLVHGSCAGLIVETEAYHESEPACHAFGGPRIANAVLFGEPGRAYVYRSYGIHALVNAVCEPQGTGAAVLIRALTPLRGLPLMRRRRGGRPDTELANGPGKLSQALGIDLDANGTSLRDGAVTILARTTVPEFVASQRIGITKAADLPWRFSVAGCRDVSRPHPR